MYLEGLNDHSLTLGIGYIGIAINTNDDQNLLFRDKINYVHTFKLTVLKHYSYIDNCTHLLEWIFTHKLR